jgi:hypothetical protein
MTIQRHEAGVHLMIARIFILAFLFVTLFTACAKHIELTGEAPLSPKPELVVQLSHTRYISAMALSANGRFLITASSETRIWDAAADLNSTF